MKIKQFIMAINDSLIAHCATCNTPLHGTFCHQCGEKQILPKHDFSIKEFVEDTIDGFTHFDSKIIRSFKYLFFRPGQLTYNFVNGLRVRFMRPVQLFIIASVFFYFFMPKSSSFYTSIYELKMGFAEQGFSLHNPFQYDIQKKINEKAMQLAGPVTDSLILKKTKNEVSAKLHSSASGLSKLLLFLLLPFWALLICWLHYRQQPYYVPHIVFALHSFSFFLLTDLLFLVFYFHILGLPTIESAKHLSPFLGLFWVYLVIALKKTYKQRWVTATWKGLFIALFLLLLLVVYRNMVTIAAAHYL